jgi:murein L,D-transpeptidase YcbB/YkuD
MAAAAPAVAPAPVRATDTAAALLRPTKAATPPIPVVQAAPATSTVAGDAAPPPPPPPPPPPFSVRARPVIDLSTIALRPSDQALILKTLDEAPSHGFTRNAFSAPDLAQQLQSEDPEVRTKADRELKVALIRYARAQHGQRVAPDSFLKDWGVRPAPWTPDRSFAAAVAQDRLAAWIDDLAPPYQGYAALRGALATYRDIAARGGLDKIAPGPILAPGATGARVTALRARLLVEDAQIAPAANPETYDADLTEAVRRYQLRNGLNNTGVVDVRTLAALNTPVEQRVMQIIANLERWRWIDRDMPATRIEVNIAAAGMTVFNNNYPGLAMRAVAGRPKDPSPMLQSRIDSIVINPPWNVPYAIAKREYWPKEKAHPGYLEAHGFRILPDGPNGGIRLQQAAGPSALGKLKFDFANPYGVYLHDTPTHSTFAAQSRAQSHGCIRLQNPTALAELLLSDMPEWTPQALQAAIESGETKRVRLQTPMDVVILYWTAYVGKGQVGFRQDVYGWDQALIQLIDAAEGPSAP